MFVKQQIIIKQTEISGIIMKNYKYIKKIFSILFYINASKEIWYKYLLVNVWVMWFFNQYPFVMSK